MGGNVLVNLSLKYAEGRAPAARGQLRGWGGGGARQYLSTPSHCKVIPAHHASEKMAMIRCDWVSPLSQKHSHSQQEPSHASPAFSGNPNDLPTTTHPPPPSAARPSGQHRGDVPPTASWVTPPLGASGAVPVPPSHYPPFPPWHGSRSRVRYLPSACFWKYHPHRNGNDKIKASRIP